MKFLMIAFFATVSVSITAWFILDVYHDDSAEQAADDLMNEYALDF